MKWQPIIKAGKLNYETEVIVHSTKSGAAIATLEAKHQSKQGTRFEFLTRSGDPITDVTHFAMITNPVNSIADGKEAGQN